MEAFTLRLSLGECSSLPGALAPLLELLVSPPCADNVVPCVVLSVRESQLFNAIDELANLFLEQGILTGILAAPRKELFVPVPSDSTIGMISGRMETTAQSVGVDIQMRMENFANLGVDDSAVYDVLLRMVLKFHFLSSGCLQFEKRGWAPQVLMLDSPRSGEVPTIALLGISRVMNELGRPIIELECMPKVMMLRTLADPADPEQPGYDPLYFCPSSGSVMVMPRMGEGWLLSRFFSNANAGKCKGEGRRRQTDKKGFHRYAPETDEEFRRYWFNVHRIRLPEDFGGYGQISFSGDLELTYPACCIVYQWTVMPSETRSKSADVIVQFQSLLQQTIGKGAVIVSSPHKQKATSVPRSVSASSVLVKKELKDSKAWAIEQTHLKKRSTKIKEEAKKKPRRRRRAQRMK